MPDPHAGSAEGLDSPADNAVAVTPDANNDLANWTRGLYLGSAGNVVVDMAGSGTSITFTVSGPTLLPIRVKRVRSATATGVVALW